MSILHRFRCKGLVLMSLLLCVLSAFAQKQTIRVIIKDSADKRPVKGASVAILSRQDSSVLEFGVADTTGKYLFKNVARL